MTTNLGQLGDLSRLEQLDQVRPRYIEKISRLLGSHDVVVLDDTNLFAGEEQFRCPLDDAGQRINQGSQGFGRRLSLCCLMHDGDDRPRGFLACSSQHGRTSVTWLCGRC